MLKWYIITHIFRVEINATKKKLSIYYYLPSKIEKSSKTKETTFMIKDGLRDGI
jgi:hypothetical protein